MSTYNNPFPLGALNGLLKGATGEKGKALEAIAAEVRDAVLAELATKSDSSPTTKTIPLDYTDIRATDEFRHKELHIIETAQFWHGDAVELSYGLPQRYADLAANYLRRQHGSNEWKPCTKEEVK